MIARGIQSFGRNGPWPAGWLSNGQIFFCHICTLIRWTNAKNFKKMSCKWTQVAQNHQKCATWIHRLQQIFSLLALNQMWIKISAWNFQHLFISCVCKFEKKILAVTQSACQPRPILAKTLDASSNHICWDIWKRKKNGEVLDPLE